MNLLLNWYKKDRSFFIATLLVLALVVILAVIIASMHLPNDGNRSTVPTTIAPTNIVQTQNGSLTNSSTVQDYVAKIKNLTSESLYYKNNMSLIGNVVISNISSVGITASPARVQPGSVLNVSVLYTGEFGFDIYNSTPYLNATREVHYFGFYQEGTNNMLVYVNRPNVSNYFALLNDTVIGTPPGYSDTKYLSIDFKVVPTANASGKTWDFCGGVFMSYSNNTNWGTEFNDLSFNRQNASNSIVFNKISGRCTLVTVT